MSDRRKNWRDAERHLKRGDVRAALSEIGKVSDGGPGDVQTLNRLGDLLARQGRSAEAVAYYAKVAEHFEQGGFEPKAIAMYKKIVRLDPNSLRTIVRLGELYLRRKLMGEARNYLLHAANQYVHAGNFAAAREVYERLAEALPEDLRHQVRLAEARAAEGDVAGAVGTLVPAGDRLLARGDTEEARQIYGRAAELAPDDDRAVCGLHRCLAAEGRTAEAVAALEKRVAKGAPVVVGELALAYDSAGRPNEAVALLTGDKGGRIPAAVWHELFRRRLADGGAEGLWPHADKVLARLRDSRPEGVAELLESLSGLTTSGWRPALERLSRHYEERGAREQGGRALERLLAAARADGDEEGAQAAEERLLILRGRRSAARSAPAQRTKAAAPASGAKVPEAPAAPPAPVLTATVPHEFEAPAVPLNRADEEFVAGGLTQAEVMEKYDLLPQALEQLDEICARFPGHVGTQESRVKLLRGMQDPQRLALALAHLALARRADGDGTGAREAAAEAAAMPRLVPEMQGVLEQLALIGAPPAEGPTVVEAAGAASASPPATPPPVELAGVLELEEGIDFDAPEDDGPAPVAASGAGAGPKRVPGEDMLQEIRESLDAGRSEEAGRRLQALVTLGYASPEMEALARDVEGSPAPSAPEAPLEIRLDEEVLRQVRDEAVIDLDSAGDLEAVAAALGAGVVDPGPLVPEAADEQSVHDILAAFKDRVKDEVASDDHRTHYDLGIGYKEMGLVEEAIREFLEASESETLHCEACSMIAVCCVEQGDLQRAAEWYRQALAGPAESDEVIAGLRYDLAEVLLQAGDADAALHEFRSVMEVHPEFRDVRGRVDELESRRQS
jgi:tetratricopeptide (TPR) repeat protein